MPIGNVPGLETELHDYQRAGIAKMLYCWNGPNKAVLLGDMMGLGKTIRAIVACVLDRERARGAFDLIVTTKTCVQQWRYKIGLHFDDVGTQLRLLRAIRIHNDISRHLIWLLRKRSLLSTCCNPSLTLSYLLLQSLLFALVCTLSL